MAPRKVDIPSHREGNSIWVRALPVSMHLGLKIGPLCPPRGEEFIVIPLSTKLHGVRSRNLDTHHRENPVGGVCFLFSFATDLCNRRGAIPLLKADKGQIYDNFT